MFRAVFEGFDEPLELWRPADPPAMSVLVAVNAAARRRDGDEGRTVLALHGPDDPRLALIAAGAAGQRAREGDADVIPVAPDLVAIRWRDPRVRETLDAVGHLLGHDLPEPLRIVGMYTQLLERSGAVEEGSLRHLHTVQSAIDRMHAMIDATLAWTRVDREPIGDDPVDLQALVGEIVGRFAPTDAVVRWSGLPTVRGNPALLELALSKVIDNAVRYRGDDAPQVEVSASRDGDGWRITCADDGPGIEAALQHLLFVPFKRLHGSDGPPGTGLGLATARRILERHGGRATIESEVGLGTRVHLVLPDHRTEL